MKIKTLDVDAKEWFDKVNGNSYFSGVVTLNYGMKNEKEYIMPFQYGYGNQYEYEALTTLEKEKVLKAPAIGQSIYRYCRENNIILRSNIQRGCLKREL